MFISENLEVKFRGSIEENIFNRSKREDKLVKFGADLKYTGAGGLGFLNLKDWSMSVVYDWKRKTTNQNKSSIEYNQSVLLVKVGMSY